MKKVFTILCGLILVASCSNEPLDADFTQYNGGHNGSGSESVDLTLSLYVLDT
ncbi:MAG: hypothetical protein HKN40_07425, partial [Winogradskyella sp.]|nr:hypothetical protein [Winogradskyella sp.]